MVANDFVTELDLVATSSQGDRASPKQLQAHEASKMVGMWVTHNSNKDTIL